MAGWNECTGGQMCAQERALVAAVCAEPYDDTPRLVYADWLDEQDPPRVTCGRCNEWWATKCPVCETEPTASGYPTSEGRTVLDTSRRWRAELIRLQCALPGIPPMVKVESVVTESELAKDPDKYKIGVLSVWQSETDVLQIAYKWVRSEANPEHTEALRRIGEIVKHARDREWFLPPGLHTTSDTSGETAPPRAYDAIDATSNGYSTYSSTWHRRVRLVIDRGFVGAVYCDLETWSGQIAPSMIYAPENGDLPDTAQPVTAVYFTGTTEAEVRELDVGLRSMWPTVRFGWLDTYGRTNPAGTVGLIELIERPVKMIHGPWPTDPPKRARRRK